MIIGTEPKHPTVEGFKQTVNAKPTYQNVSNIQYETLTARTVEPADEDMYEIALNELDNDKQVSAIYAKALALSQGDTDKARWKYVDLRVGHMKAEEVKKMDLKSQAANRLAERQRLDKRNSNLFDTVLIGVFLICQDLIIYKQPNIQSVVISKHF